MPAISRILFDPPVREWGYEFQKISDDAPILLCLQNFIGNPSGSQKDILKLLDRSGGMGATVPRDRIFALSALTTDDLGLEFNYKKSLHDYLEEIIKGRCLSHGFQLEPLDLKNCAWASGSPSWVAKSHEGFELKLLTTINFHFLYLDHDISILQDSKKWPQDFKACGDGPFHISAANFPKSRVLKLQCHMIGEVHDAQKLEATEEEEKQHKAMLEEASKHTDPRYFNSLIASSWLAAVCALQKMKTFLGGPEPRKLSDLDTSKDDENNDELSGQVFSLFLRPSTSAQGGSDDFCRTYEDAVQTGYQFVCKNSESLLSLVDQDAELWAIVGNMIKLSSFYVSSMEAMCAGRSIFKAAERFIGVGPNETKAGDCMVIIPGVGVPYIVRPAGSNSYKIIGDAYVPGIMYGEFVEQEGVPAPVWLEFC